MLSQRPFRYGKTLFALANLAFLRHYFDFEGGVEYEPVLRSFSTPEEVASAVSTVLALANDIRPLESTDVSLPLAGLNVDSGFIEVLNYGHAISTLAEAEKLIASLGYRLAQVHAGKPLVFQLRPPAAELEYFLRLGFVRSQLGQTSSQLRLAQRGGNAPLSILAAVDSILDSSSDEMATIVDRETPYRRLRMQVPMLPSLFEKMSGFAFYEDLVMEERLSEELELPLRRAVEHTWNLTEHLDLPTFLRAWRVVRFLNVMDIALLKRHEQDPILVGNSLVRFASEAKHIELLTAFGLTPEQVRSFLHLVYLDVNTPGHVDIQYRPFLIMNEGAVQVGDDVKTTPREVVHASSLVAMANIIPNLQRCHSVRAAANAEGLPRPLLKFSGGSGDILRDVLH